MDRSFCGQYAELSAVHSKPQGDKIHPGIGKREEGELAATLGIVYRSRFNSSRGRLPFLLKTFPAENRTPLSRLERHRGFFAALRACGAGFHFGEAVTLSRRCGP